MRDQFVRDDVESQSESNLLHLARGQVTDESSFSDNKLTG